MTKEHLQKIRKELPALLHHTELFYFKNDFLHKLDIHKLLYFKRQVRYHLYLIARRVLNSQDIWSIITDILFTHHSKTLYSILSQITHVYIPTLLPLFTASQLTLSLFHTLSQAMHINLILFRPQLLPDHVVRLEQFNIDTLLYTQTCHHTWIIYTEPIDCLFSHDLLSHVVHALDDPAIHVDPIDLPHEFLLTHDQAKNIQSYSDHFMRITYNFHYRSKYLQNHARFQRFPGSRWNALFYIWGGERAVLPDEAITVRTFITHCIKISTSVNGLVSVIYGDHLCSITRFPNKSYYICHISQGELSLPYYQYEELHMYHTVLDIAQFINMYGDIRL